MLKSKLNRFIKFIRVVFEKIRSSRTFTNTLILISIVYPIILIITVWDKVQQLDWSNFFVVLIFCVLNYSVSSFFQSLNWSLILDGSLRNYHLNGNVYYKSMLMNRLPGGFWHWIGRSSLFEQSSHEERKNVGQSNLIEWIGLWLSGISVYLTTKVLPVGILSFAITIGFISYLYSRFTPRMRTIRRSILIVSIYALCWIIGAIFLMWLINNVENTPDIPLIRAIQNWTIFGSVSNLLFFIPSGMVVREFTLSALLSDILTAKQIILLSVQLRVVITIADIVTASLMLQLIKLFSPKVKFD